MRKTYQYILKIHFNPSLVQAHSNLQPAQSKMVKRLFMDDRSCIDLDHGKTRCNAVTLALHLAFVCNDVCQFAEELRYAFI